MREQGQPGMMPKPAELRQASRADLERAIRVMGGRSVAERGGWQRSRTNRTPCCVGQRSKPGPGHGFVLIACDSLGVLVGGIFMMRVSLPGTVKERR